MKVSRPNSRTLIWQEKQSLAYLLFTGFILLIFLRFDVELARTVGRITYACQRIGPEQADCQRVERAYLGVIVVERADFSRVTAAEAIQDINESADYRYELHSVVLSTATGNETLVEPPLMIAGRRGDPQVMEAIASDLTQFLQSGRLTWTHQTWNDGSLMMLSLFIQLTGFIGFAIAVLTTQYVGDVTYRVEQGPTSLTGEPSFSLTRQGRWHARRLTFTPEEIDSVTVVRQVIGGKHRRVIYRPVLTLKDQSMMVMSRESTQLQAEGIVRYVTHFLDYDLDDDAVPQKKEAQQTRRSPGLQPQFKPHEFEQMLFKGPTGTYTTTHTPTLPTSASPRLRRAHETVLELGGRYLGDIQSSRTIGTIIYGYVIPKLNSYVVLYYAGFYAGMDFYCTFSKGSSLTTSSRLMLFVNWGQPPTYFRSHFLCKGTRLYHWHRRHIQSLERHAGHVQRIRPSLATLAKAIDGHLRRRKGLLIGL